MDLNKFNKKRTCILSLIAFCFIIFNAKAFCVESKIGEIPVRQESITVIKNDRVSSERYKVCAGDVLAVSVYDEPNLAQPDIIVRPDGYITIDPIGEVFVEGYDITEITRILEGKFKDYLNEPKISLSIKEFNPASIYIFGAVQKPGTYQQITQTSKYYGDTKNPSVKTDLTIANVISNAGGISIDADLANIKITGVNKKERVVDLWKFIKDGDISQNIKLKSGDVIFVPKAEAITINDDNFKLLTQMALFPEAFPVRVVGEVKTGGTYSIKGDSPYLNTAISDANGYTLDANKTTVLVYRQTGNNKLAKIYVDPFKQDFVLRPNDIVEVRKRNFMKVVSGAEYASRIISPFSALPAAGNSWADWFKPDRRYYRY